VTRKDYEKIAEVIRNLPGGQSRIITAREFATMLKRDNERFDTLTFYRACQIQND
jgi:hypothetical protein